MCDSKNVVLYFFNVFLYTQMCDHDKYINLTIRFLYYLII